MLGTLRVDSARLVTVLVLGVVSVRLFGFSPGQLALGLKVVAVDGRGYVGAYTYIGTYRSTPVAGSAYLEWVDTQP